jgi:tetratricopeptide (TPR) repeat protein
MPWHLGGVLLHLLATALVFYVARRLLRDEAGAAFAALIFGLHPIHVECVAWATGATDTLMAIFVLGSFLAYLRFRDRGARRWPWFAISVMLYGIGCLAKEPAIVLPGLIALYEWLLTPAEASSNKARRIAAIMAPYAAVAAGYLVQRWAVLRGIGHAPLDLPLWKMPLSWPELLWFYTEKLVWPAGLALFYHVQYLATPDLDHFWLPLLFVTASWFAVVLVVRRLPATSVDGLSPRAIGWMSLAWFLLPLLPALDIFPLQPDELAHDRYLYLPALGLALLVALAIRRIDFGKARLFAMPAVQVAMMVLLSSTMALATVRQSSYWANDLLLCYRAVKISPGSPNVTRWLGDALLQRGYTEEGVRVHQQLLQRHPEFWWSHFQLGNGYYTLRRYADSEQQMLEAVRLNPSAPQLRMYLALVEIKNGHNADAEQTLRTAIALAPAAGSHHYLLGLVMEQQQRWPEAVAAFEQELAIDPNQPKVRAELENARRHLN